jgi:hypothetical protein
MVAVRVTRSKHRGDTWHEFFLVLVLCHLVAERTENAFRIRHLGLCDVPVAC